MIISISKYWWAMLIRGLLLLSLGLIALFDPQLSASALVLYLGFMSTALVVLFLYLGLRAKLALKRRLVYLIIGCVDAVVAYYCLVETAFASTILLLIIGLWAVLMGLTIVGFGLQAKGTSRVLMLINGALSIALGALLYFNPFRVESINYMAGFYLVLLSFFLLYLSFKMRQAYHAVKNTAGIVNQGLHESSE